MSGFGGRWTPYHTGLAIVGLGGFLFTLDVPLLRLAEADKWTMLLVRGVFLGIGISIWWLLLMRGRGGGEKVPYINGWPGLIVAITNTIANLSFMIALTLTTAANVVFMLALNPIFCAILARVFLKERIHFWTGIAIMLCVYGVYFIYSDSMEIYAHTQELGPLIGDFLACIAAMCTAVALVVIRYSKKNVIPSLAVGSFASAAAAAAVMLVATDPAHGLLASLVSLSGSGYFWLGLNGLLVLPLSSALMALGPKYLPAPEVAVFFLLETVLVPIWVFLIFGELPTTHAAIGGLIIIVTLVAHSYWRLRVSAHQHRVSQPT